MHDMLSMLHTPAAGAALLALAAALGAGAHAALTRRRAAPPPPDSTAELARLRHDIRGILSPAMLVADRLTTHQDPAVQRAGALVIDAVEKVAARLTSA